MGRIYSRSDKVRAFLDEVLEASKRHGLSISHEDGHGSFIVEQFKQDNIDWLNDAAESVGEL